MGILLFTAGSHYLRKRKIDLQYEQTAITQRLTDLESFADFVGQGDFSANAVTSLPITMVGRAMSFVTGATSRARAYADSNVEAAMQQYYGNMEMSAEEKAQRRAQLLDNLYRQYMNQEVQNIQRFLHKENERIVQHQKRIQSRQDEVEKLLAKFESAKEQSIDEIIPNIGGSRG